MQDQLYSTACGAKQPGQANQKPTDFKIKAVVTVLKVSLLMVFRSVLDVELIVIIALIKGVQVVVRSLTNIFLY